METLKKRSLFWDVENLDSQKNKRFIIERILNFGNEDDFRWALDFYGEEKIKEAFVKSKSMTKKSLSFWRKIFKFNEKECLLKQSIKIPGAFWTR